MFRVLARTRAGGSPRLSMAMVVALAVAAAASTLSPWSRVPFSRGFDPRMAPLVAAMPALNPDSTAIRQTIANPEHLGIADPDDTVIRPEEEAPMWTAMGPGSSLVVLPAGRRRLYLARSAARLRRPGWIILAGGHRAWLDDFLVAYRVAESWTAEGATLDESGARISYLVAKLIPR